MGRYRYQYGPRAVWQKRIRNIRNILVILIPIGVLGFWIFGNREDNLVIEQGQESSLAEMTTSSPQPTTPVEEESSIVVEPTKEPQLDLPLLKLYYYYFSEDDIDGEILKDISEAVPPRGEEETAEFLPVYHNPYYRSYENTENQDVDYEQLRRRTEEIKDSFGLSNVEGAVETPGSIQQVPSYTTVAPNYEITVFESGDVRLYFRDKIDLPAGFTYEYTVEKELFLVDYYLDLLGGKINNGFGSYENREVTVSYLPSGDAIYYITIYQVPRDESIKEQLMAREFETLWMYTQSDGLYGLFYSKQRPNEEMIISDYPIISKDEAMTEFLNGNYLGHGSVSTEDIRKRDIKAVQLEYFHQAYQPFLMPVYVFYVEYDEEMLPDLYDEGLAEGLKTYIRFYVPAVPLEYVEEMASVYYPS